MNCLKMLLLFFSVLMQMANSQEDWPCNHEIFCKPDDGILHELEREALLDQLGGPLRVLGQVEVGATVSKSL